MFIHRVESLHLSSSIQGATAANLNATVAGCGIAAMTDWVMNSGNALPKYKASVFPVSCEEDATKYEDGESLGGDTLLALSRQLMAERQSSPVYNPSWKASLLYVGTQLLHWTLLHGQSPRTSTPDTRLLANGSAGGIYPALFSLPITAAAPTMDRLHVEPADYQHYEAVVTDTSAKRWNIAQITTLLRQQQMMSDEECNQLEFDWLVNAADVSLNIHIDTQPGVDGEHKRRVKRISHNKFIAQHIEANCAFGRDILDPEGEKVGKEIFILAEKIQDPIGLLFGNTQEEESSTAMHYFKGFVRMTFSIFFTGATLGVGPLLQSVAANSLKAKYHRDNGDAICARRYIKMMVADTQLTVMPGKMAKKPPLQAPNKLPKELVNANPLEPRAAFRSRDPVTNIEHEVLIKVNDQSPGVSGKMTETYVKPVGESGFHTFQSGAGESPPLGRKVIYDKTKNVWHYADAPDGAALNIEIREGKRYVRIAQQNHELHKTAKGKYAVSVNNKDGTVSTLGVYYEPIAGKWQLQESNGYNIFGRRTQEIIARNKLQPDFLKDGVLRVRQQVDTRIYGGGKVYDVFRPDNAGDMRYLNSIVELQGELLPVSIKRTVGQPERYRIHDTQDGVTKLHALSWDGGRWIFERSMPHCMQEKIAALFKPEMAEINIDVSKLSPPDRFELRWDGSGNAFWQLKKSFYNVRPSRLDENVFYLRHQGRKWSLVHENNKLRMETLGERIHRLKTQGLSGYGKLPSEANAAGSRSTHTAVEVVQAVFGMDAAEARAYLAQYRFEPHGLLNANAFARHLEQYNALPGWAERIRIHDPASTQATLQQSLGISAELARQYLKQYRFEPTGPHSEKAFVDHLSQYQRLPEWAEPYRIKGVMEHLGEFKPVAPGPDGKKIALGAEIGQGTYGTTFHDARDPRFVIKRLKKYAEIFENVSGSDSIDHANQGMVDDPAVANHGLRADHDRPGPSNRGDVSMNSDSDSPLSMDELWQGALDEADLFQRYYGLGTAEVIVEDQHVYIRMLKIPGTPLYNVQAGGLASDAVERYVDMLEGLTERGILHPDLHDGNILYHQGVFYPVDLGNTYDTYFHQMADSGKALDNMSSERLFNSVIANIKAKQAPKDASQSGSAAR